MPKHSSNKPAKINPDVEYHETMESIRHYSRMRWTLLSVFSAINAALIYIVFRSGLDDSDSVNRTAVSIVGLTFAVVFLWIEIVLDKYKINFCKYAKKHFPHSHWEKRPEGFGLYVRIPVGILYLLPFGFWIYVIFVG